MFHRSTLFLCHSDCTALWSGCGQTQFTLTQVEWQILNQIHSWIGVTLQLWEEPTTISHQKKPTEITVDQQSCLVIAVVKSEPNLPHVAMTLAHSVGVSTISPEEPQCVFLEILIVNKQEQKDQAWVKKPKWEWWSLFFEVDCFDLCAANCPTTHQKEQKRAITSILCWAKKSNSCSMCKTVQNKTTKMEILPVPVKAFVIANSFLHANQLATKNLGLWPTLQTLNQQSFVHNEQAKFIKILCGWNKICLWVLWLLVDLLQWVSFQVAWAQCCTSMWLWISLPTHSFSKYNMVTNVFRAPWSLFLLCNLWEVRFHFNWIFHILFSHRFKFWIENLLAFVESCVFWKRLRHHLRDCRCGK